MENDPLDIDYAPIARVPHWAIFTMIALGLALCIALAMIPQSAPTHLPRCQEDEVLDWERAPHDNSTLYCRNVDDLVNDALGERG